MPCPTTGTKFKRGTHFHASLVFNEEEWADIYPFTNIRGEARQEDARYPLTVTVDAANRIIDVSADTTNWALGYAEFDVKMDTLAGPLIIPPTRNIGFRIVEGVTR